MRVKKFVCYNCGAPKINPYTTPYIICDYCGAFTDYDYTVVFQDWLDHKDSSRFVDKEGKILSKIDDAILDGDRDKVYKLKYKLRELYLRTYPSHKSPLINTEEKFKTYLELYARYETRDAFDKKIDDTRSGLQKLEKELAYYEVKGALKVEPNSFFRLTEAWLKVTEESIQRLFDSPEGELMKNFFPQHVYQKISVSKLVQMWLPYLLQHEGDRLLEMTGFSHEYVVLNEPETEAKICSNCGKEMSVPKGSFSMCCDHCHTLNTIKSSFNCMNCGSENPVPANPANPVDCAHCGTENRLVQPLYWQHLMAENAPPNVLPQIFTKNCLIIASQQENVEQLIADANVDYAYLFGATTLEDVKIAFSTESMDEVIIGSEIDLEERLEIIRFIFNTSKTTRIHLKDEDSDHKGMLAFVKGILKNMVPEF